jgi:hypothetical protein
MQTGEQKTSMQRTPYSLAESGEVIYPGVECVMLCTHQDEAPAGIQAR